MELDGPDLFHVTQEAPDRPTHTLKIAVLDGNLEPDKARSWLADACERIPLFSWQLDASPLRPHRWVEAAVDLDHHFEHVQATAPGGEDQLVEILEGLCGRALDRDRPLWALHLITGLRSEGRPRTAVVLRLHHALADGAASARLWEELAGIRSAERPAVGGAVPSRVRHLGSVVADAPRLARRWRAHSRRLAEAKREGETPAVDPFAAPITPFNEHLEGPRSCAFATVPLERVKAAGAAFGASVNEVLLAISGGAIHGHLEDRGVQLDASLTTTLPAGLPERSRPHGNAVTTLYVSLHSHLDPAARVAAIQKDLRSARAVLEEDPRLLPDSQRRWRFYQLLVAAMRREERRRARPAYNTIVSSVRGPAPFEIAGHPVVALRSLGPLAGRLGLNITAWSYGGDLSIGVHAYRAAAEDLADLARRLCDELAALEAAATG